RAAAAVLVVAVALLPSVACGDDGGDGRDGGDGAASGEEEAQGDDRSDTGGTSTPEEEGPFAVGHRSLTLVDGSRPTDAVADVLPARPDRTIEVEVVYPAQGDAGPEPTGDLLAAGAAVR